MSFLHSITKLFYHDTKYILPSKGNEVNLSLWQKYALCCLFTLCASSFWQHFINNASAQGDAINYRLFGTVEFKTPLKDMPKWQRVFDEEGKKPVFKDNIDNDLPKGFVTRWGDILSRISAAPEMEQVKFVNSFFNQWPYRTDLSNYGVEDYWSYPREFIKKSGDCEDYAISKFFALKFIGFPENKMRIVIVKDTIRNLAHAILAVYIGDNIYILDNLSSTPLSHKVIKNYLPFYSFNLEFRWAHLPVKK